MTRKNLTTIHPGEFLAEALGELDSPRRRSRVPSAYPRCGYPTW